MRAPLILAAASLAATPGHAADLGPLAPAAEGKVQCYRPNEVAKTCESIGAYRVTPDGQILNTAIVLISASPAIVMSTESAVSIKGGQDCGVTLPKHIDAATFEVEGRPADPALTQKLRAQLKARMTAFFGHETCVAYVPDGAAWLATSRIDGVAHPEMDLKVIWVSPADGYRVAP